MNGPKVAAGPPILRVAHAQAFSAYLKHIGAPAGRLLRRNGLAVYCDDPDEFVPLHQAWSYFDSVAQHEGSDLGWQVGRYVGDHNLNQKFRRKIESAPTLYEALKVLIRLASCEASHLHVGILEGRHEILFFTHYPMMRGVPGYTFSQTYQLGLIIDLVRHFLGKNWVPAEIGIEHPSVPKAAEELFPGSRIRVQQRMGYFTVPRSCLHTPSCGSDSESIEDEDLTLTKELNFADTLAVLIHPYLLGGYPTMRLAASLMDTSVRSLARRLAECGVTYREVIDPLRFKKAKKLLRDTNMRITDVAIDVGFDDSANFARMFRRIGGLSPLQFRRASQQS